MNVYEGAFYNCAYIEQIYINAGATGKNIGKDAFRGCVALKQLGYCDANGLLTSVSNGVFDLDSLNVAVIAEGLLNGATIENCAV